MFKVLVITDEELGTGFRLAGVDVIEVSALSEAETLLRECMADESYGIILINEEYLSHFELKTRKNIEESTVPLIIPISVRMDWEFEDSRADYIGDIVRRSIGYQIRLH